MSTQIDRNAQVDDSKQQERVRSGKDDFKQQAALNKKQQSESKSKDSDVPVDSGSSLVGGAVSAVQSAVDRGINLLPESVQKQAPGLIDQAATLTKPIVDSFQQEGIVAAAKTAGGLGADAVSNIAGSGKEADAKQQKAKPKAKEAKGKEIKDKETKGKDAKGGKDKGIVASAADSAAGLKSAVLNTASSLQSQASSAAASLKSTIAPAKEKAKEVEGDVAEAVAPKKKHGRRRRGGRGHGNRKFKTRELPPAQEESIADTLGEKAKEIKDIVVEAPKAVAPKSSSSGSGSKGRGSGGVVDSIRSTVGGVTSGISSTVGGVTSGISSTVSGVTSGISNTVSSSVTGAKNTAVDLAAGAGNTASGLVAGAQDKLGMGKSDSGKGKSGKTLDRKPTLERQDALPALGTPNTPGDSSVTRTGDGKLAANPGDQSSLLDKAKFAIGAVQDYVVDKIDNLSMNADDTEPMEGAEGAKGKGKEGALDNAKAQLKEMKESVADKGKQAKGEAEKLANKNFINKDKELKSSDSGSKAPSKSGKQESKDSSADKGAKNPVKNLNKEASKDITSKQA